jgi:hypothetical protein
MVLFRGCLALSALVAFCFFPPTLAHAELGGNAPSVVAVTTRFSALHRQARVDGYRLHELAVPEGPVLREYENQAGRVFAVSWSGGGRPDLRVLLGAHYEAYIAACKGRRARGAHRIDVPGMTIVQGGTQRALFGKVVLTGDLPEGLRMEDLR